MYVLIRRICVTSNCKSSADESLSSFEASKEFNSVRGGEFLPYGYIITGIVTNALLAAACVVTGFVILFVWKLTRLAWVYLLILVLLLIGEYRFYICRT
jgi:hypothetical protein